MRQKRLSTLGLGLTAALLAGVLAPGIALAAPGDASARGVVVALDAELSGVPLVEADRTVGAADAPPGGGTDTDTLIDIGDAFAGALGVIATGTVEEVTATRGTISSSAFAAVDGVSLGVLGIPVLSTGEVSATAVCPVAGALTADTTLAGLTLFGAPAVLDENTPGVTATSGVTVAGLTDAELAITVQRLETTTATDATAVAVQATLTLTGTAVGVPVTIPLGTVTIASATCTRPAAVPPTATGIAPDSGPQAGGQTVTITGTAFVPGQTTVLFDGVPATAVTVAPDGSSLTAVTPAGAPGPATVVVQTLGGAAAPLAYTYLADGSSAVVTSVTPRQGPTAGGTTVTIQGSGFTGATGVTFGGVPATGVTVNPAGTVITAVTPPNPAGLAAIELVFPGGTASAGDFFYVAAAAPTISGLDPDSGPTTGGTTVTITGTGLAGTTAVTFDGAPATIVGTPTATTLTVTTPPGTAGPADVAVTTGAGTGTLAGAFTYVAPGGASPTATALSPTSGPTTGGQTVVITGSGFVAGETAVTFDGVAAASVQVEDGDTLLVVTPPGAAGPAEVVVTVSGVAADPLDYTYVAGATVPAAPSVAGLEPASGPVEGGTRVTAVGRNFVPGQTSVIICGTTLLPTAVQVAEDGESLTFTAPECAAGVAEVTVVTPGGTATADYTYVAGVSDEPAEEPGAEEGVGSGSAGGLPDTGADIAGAVLLGLVLLVTGAGLARRARRREPVVD